MAYLLRRRSNKTPRSLDNAEKLDTDQKDVQHTFEVADNSRAHELSEQPLLEISEQSRVELSGQSLVELSGQNHVELQHVASPRVSGGGKSQKMTLKAS